MERNQTFSVYGQDGNEAVINKEQWEEWRERGYKKIPPKKDPPPPPPAPTGNAK